jgi:hypothetical protein
MQLIGKANSDKRTCHFDIKYIRKFVEICNCSKNMIIANFMIKMIVTVSYVRCGRP